jgi:hypothetical protein
MKFKSEGNVSEAGAQTICDGTIRNETRESRWCLKWWREHTKMFRFCQLEYNPLTWNYHFSSEEMKSKWLGKGHFVPKCVRWYLSTIIYGHTTLNIPNLIWYWSRSLEPKVKSAVLCFTPSNLTSCIKNLKKVEIQELNSTSWPSISKDLRQKFCF